MRMASVCAIIYDCSGMRMLIIPAEPYFPRNKIVRFEYNPLFSIGPSEASNKAWDSQTPAGRGFIQAPLESGTAVYGLTVFHQLHCIDMIRHGFYHGVTDDRIAVRAEEHSQEEEHHMIDPRAHARHCFDYLRQTVQCTADTNLEPVDFSLGGVKGWTEHVCRDFEAVQRYAVQRRPEREGNPLENEVE